VKCTLVTQNIDDYDAQLIKTSKILTPEPLALEEGTSDYAFTPYVLEMHGNTRYMHCFDEDKDCSRYFYLAPTLDEVHDRTNHVPKCPVCASPMKPHAMFFDESYNEHYYRDCTTKLAAEDIDALIVVGTALQTTGARRLVYRVLS